MNSDREQTISALKHLLCEKHGSRQLKTVSGSGFSGPGENENQTDGGESLSAPFFRTGVACLDASGIHKGGVYEIISETPGASGSGWLMEQLILHAQTSSASTTTVPALIDGADSFDPESSGVDALPPFLWVRCRETREAMKSADWLLRDGNLPLVMLDLQMNAPSGLRCIPASSWYRLRSVAEESGTTFLVFSSGREKLVPCAHLRLIFRNRLSLADLDRERDEIDIQLITERRRIQQAPTTTAENHALAKAG